MDTTLCFACLRQESKESCRNVFTSNGKIAKDIYQFANIVTEDTETILPTEICTNCYSNLEKALNFRLQLKENYEKFKKMQQKSVKMETEEQNLIITSVQSETSSDPANNPQSSSFIIEVLAQINQSIKNLSGCYESIDARLRNIESTLAPQEVLDSFTISPIGCSEDFDVFLNMIGDDQDFRRNLVSFLFNNCDRGSASKPHFGIVKNIMDRLFTKDFILKCRWAGMRKKEGESSSSTKYFFSEIAPLKSLILSVLNYKTSGVYTPDDVQKAVQEFFKRLDKGVGQKVSENSLLMTGLE